MTANLQATSATQGISSVVEGDVPSLVESVAKALCGISIIGQARDALQTAGWSATISANRITIDDVVEAQFIPAKVGRYGKVDARWIVSSAYGPNRVWVVGAESAF